MKKVLLVTHVVKHHLIPFHIPYIKWFKQNGYETYVCARNDYENKDDCRIPYCDHYYDLPFKRFPVSMNNLYAYKKLKQVINKNQFDIIHCHTPVGGVLTRLAARKSRINGTKVIYTAHGFHFFKGAPLLNWLIYYPIEKICSHFTDVLITINQEDYSLAKNKMKAQKLLYIQGVGIDTQKIFNILVEKKQTRHELGISEKSIMLLSVGELNRNKNHELIFRSLAKLNNSDVHYFIAGVGDLATNLNKLAKSLNITENIHILGYRTDIPQLLMASDIFVFPSRREGLSVALMEAMLCGLPVVCSEIRGNSDLIHNAKGGFLIKVNNPEEYANKLNILLQDRELCRSFGEYNKAFVNQFTIENVMREIEKLYCSL